jgi:sodium/potassium-transporting ATPase subunit alpha
MAPAISMAYEGKESNIMTRKPRDPERDNLVTWRLVSFAYLQIGVLQALAGFYAYMVVLWDGAGIDPRSLTNLDGETRFERADDLLYCCDYTTCRYDDLTKGEVYFTNPTHDIAHWNDYCGKIPRADWTVDGLEKDVRVNTLRAAQTAYFISIIVVQWADLLICKTRTLSIFTHGMNNTFMNKAIVFETILGAGISYLPFVNLVGTRPLKFVWWCSAIPFNFCIFVYDESRKAWIRKNPKGWLQRTTYW